MKTYLTPRAPKSRLLVRLGWSALVGLAVATALTIYSDTAGHAALIKSAARPAGAGGRTLSPGQILADGFIVTFVIVTVVAFIILTVDAFRRARRSSQAAVPAGRPAGARRVPLARSDRGGLR